MSGSDNNKKEPGGGPLLNVPESCASCNLAEKFEFKAGSIVALCNKNDCTRYSKPVSYKYIAELKPSDKINAELLEYARAKVAERIVRERQRQTKRMKHDEEKGIATVMETMQIAHFTTENLPSPPQGLESQFTELDEELRQIHDSYESKFEGIRKRLVKAKEFRATEQAEPKSEGQAGTRGWDQLIEKYRKMLKVAEPELNGLQQKASGINEILETKMNQAEEELPIKECELKVEQDLKEDTKNIEQLEKQVGSLRKQQEECLPRREKLKNLLDRMQYCATETRSVDEQSVSPSPN